MAELIDIRENALTVGGLRMVNLGGYDAAGQPLGPWVPAVVLTDRSGGIVASVNSDGSLIVSAKPTIWSPLGYNQIGTSALAAAVGLGNGLTAFGLPGVYPPTATMALILAETNAVRWRDDGVAPTASVGMQLKADQEFQYTGDLSRIRFIAVSGSPVLNVSFYR